MATSKAAKKSVGTRTAGQRLYTLTEIGELASVSMPTLQKYKRLYQDRIPSVGEGRKQRYPRAAVAVLRQLKKENLAKRGRPPKNASEARVAAPTQVETSRPAASSTGDGGLLTLTEISRRTRISYPTVSRYVKVFLDRIPHVGSGRKRRFPRSAVEVFLQLRSESRPGRPSKAPKAAKVAKAPKPWGTAPKKLSAGAAAYSSSGSSDASNAALVARLEGLERAQADLSEQVASVLELLRRPIQVSLSR